MTSFFRMILLGILLIETQQLVAQQEFRYINDIDVFENDEVLANPFAGGLNSGQYNTVDLDGDNNLDLVIFDRTSNKINTFINTGSNYDYQPEYEHFFPEDLENWIVFADYDCDNKKDIFTYTNFGIRVFRNTSSGGIPSWELKEDPLFTLGTSSKINLFLNSTDIPGIGDIDGDGDLDILVFNFVNGAKIEFHQNFSVERTGDCGSLDFERVTSQYGDIEECICGLFTFGGEACPTGGRQQHSGGKTIHLYDYDNDNDMDLIIGQELCVDVYLIENKGTATVPLFDSFTNFFPEALRPLNMISFPTTFVEDLNFDGLKDIVVAPNIRSNPGLLIDYQNSSWLYENTGSGSNNSFSIVQRNFLQDEMIEVGEYAYPTFSDIDDDGDDDLIIGNRALSGGYFANLQLYRNDPSGFTLIAQDYLALSFLRFIDITPKFQDLNNDGRPDLVFTGRNTLGSVQLYYLLNTAVSGFYEFDLTQLVALPIALGGSDDPVLVDIDGDQVLDLLIGRSTGRLTYLNNTGTNLEPAFEVVNETFLGLDFGSSNSNLSLTVADINTDGLQDLITTDRSGAMKIYSDFINDQEQIPQSEILSIENTSGLQPTKFGRVSKPAVGRYNNLTLIAVGGIQGGIRLIGTEGSSGSESELDVTVFPVPSKSDKIIKLKTTSPGVEFEVFGISGERIIPLTFIEQFSIQQINLSSLEAGLYFVRFQNQDDSKTVKFLLGDG